MRLADRTFLPFCVFISVGHTSTRHTETPYIGYRRLRKKQPSYEMCRIMRSPRLPQISKLIQLTERARAKMAVFSQTDPLLYRNLATLSLGRHGELRSICFARWLFFSQTPDSIFGVLVFADDRFTEPTFGEGGSSPKKSFLKPAEDLEHAPSRYVRFLLSSLLQAPSPTSGREPSRLLRAGRGGGL